VAGLYTELNYPSGYLEAIKLPLTNVDLNMFQPAVGAALGAALGRVAGVYGTYMANGYSLRESHEEVYDNLPKLRGWLMGHSRKFFRQIHLTKTTSKPINVYISILP
jgi:hypothetical protein